MAAIHTILFLFIFAKSTEQLNKIWIAQDDLTNPKMWSPPKIPCPRDKVVFPKNLTYGIRVPMADVRVKELQLPVDGSIIFEGLILSDDHPVRDCPGETIQYTRNILHAWSDPKNWLIDIGPTDDHLDSGLALPDLYRLPCVTDKVSMYPEYTPLGRLPTKRQFVNGISINGREYSNDDWQAIESSFEKDTEDENVLSDAPTVKIVGDEFFTMYKYGEPACQENVPPELCDYKECQPPKCLQPVKPYYHCCELCGAVITVGTMDRLLKVKVTVLTQIAKNTGVDIWVGVVSRNHVVDKNSRPTLYSQEWLSSNYNIYQIVLVDAKIYSQISTSVAKTLIEVLKKELNLLSGDGMLLSGIPWAGPNVSPGGWEALIMLFVVLSTFLAVMLYHYPPSSFNGLRYRSFTFARFENRSREGSLVQGISQLSLNKEFDNPMYSAHDADDDKQTIAEDITEDSDVAEVELESSQIRESKTDDQTKEDETTFVKSSLSALLEKDNDGTY